MLFKNYKFVGMFLFEAFYLRTLYTELILQLTGMKEEGSTFKTILRRLLYDYFSQCCNSSKIHTVSVKYSETFKCFLYKLFRILYVFDFSFLDIRK